MTSGYLLESDYLEAIKMTSITTAKMEKLEEKTKIEEGNFDTKEKGLTPPLVTTKFTVNDYGNASPR